jgi:VWFA-related protein
MPRHITAFTAFILLALTGSAQDFQVRTRVDLVVVPTSVRDSEGRLVAGLGKDDFTITEDGQPQQITNFSVDPQPLSAAIVIDTGMGGNALRRLTPLFIAVTSGFSEFDEMASFRYDHLTHQLSEFTSDHEAIEKSFDIVKQIAEKQPANVPAGGAAPTMPKILQLLLGSLRNGANSDAANPSKPPTEKLPTVKSGPAPQSRILYDAVYEAAKALETRPPNRRRIVFIISDGQVSGTLNHNLQDTTEFMLRRDVELFAVATDYGAFEGRFGALNSMASATGGAVYTGLSTDSMERAFGRITEEARNQYVLGYHSSNTGKIQLPVFRAVEVKGKESSWKVTHRKGYYQMP